MDDFFYNSLAVPEKMIFLLDFAIYMVAKIHSKPAT